MLVPIGGHSPDTPRGGGHGRRSENVSQDQAPEEVWERVRQKDSRGDQEDPDTTEYLGEGRCFQRAGAEEMKGSETWGWVGDEVPKQ